MWFPQVFFPDLGTFPWILSQHFQLSTHVCYKTTLEQEGSSRFLCTINFLSLISISGSGVFLDYKWLGESKDFLVTLTV